ncbi:Alpha/Beta hydrolase protein [Hyaloscypha finlandica]|nr:Alpha/Beta hydrolase protein [Hyaloscypha finlandica]
MILLGSTRAKQKVAYVVDALPNVLFDVGEMYASLVPIDMNNTSRALYFVSQPTVGAPVDEITIWLNSRPGNGDLAWVSLTNVLWVEQPVGTGFSIGEVTATNETNAAKDFNNFFLNFLELLGLSFKIPLIGESYPGRYVPSSPFQWIRYLPFVSSRRALTISTGALMYDPCIGSYVWEQNQASWGLTDLSCDLFGMVYAAAFAPNPCFNIHEISSQCPLLLDPLGYPTGLQRSYPGQPIYSNRTDVKKTTNAPLDGDTSPDPIQFVLPRVIEATNRVLVSNGDLDMSIIADGTLSQQWPPIGGPQGTMGIQYRERDLMLAQTYLSGHMQPQSKPRSSYRHLQWLLGHFEML